MAITLTKDDILKNLQSEYLDAITGDDAIITDAISKAVRYVTTYVAASGKIISDDIQIDAAIHRTIYGLYIYSQDYQLAQEHRSAADDILEIACGFKNDGQSISKPQPVSYVVHGRTDWNGY